MTIAHQIVSGWFLVGLTGTVLSKSRIIFNPPPKVNLKDFPEHQRGFVEQSQKILKQNPLLDFIIDLILGMLYIGQLNFLMVFVWLYRLIIFYTKWMWFHITKPILKYNINKRMFKLKYSIERTNPNLNEEQVDEMIMVLCERWNNIYRKDK
jgi:hypothetical protein